MNFNILNNLKIYNNFLILIIYIYSILNINYLTYLKSKNNENIIIKSNINE